VSVSINVDPTNPGQFFACCGLLEMANRLWGGAEGWFEPSKRKFCMQPVSLQVSNGSARLVFPNSIIHCSLANTMTQSQLQRRDHLSSVPRKDVENDPLLESEKKFLDSLWREAPVVLGFPFNLKIDWFIDDRSGGDTFKTWAGQQSVIDIADGMLRSSIEAGWEAIPPEDWLFKHSSSAALPFNFDSDLGSVGRDRDVGFSFDPLKNIKVQVRPLVEFLAFIGLQRFRPAATKPQNRFRYWLWFDGMVPEIAAAAACGLLELPTSSAFEFPLLYRTKYLKSFLPATPVPRSEL
jgi:CRISPR-associated protein Csb3